jgi:hypothetical protein
MPAGPEIDFARYAEICAHLRHFPADTGDEVLSRLGLRRRAWDAAASRWTAARDREIEEGRVDLTERFGRLVADARERLETTRPRLVSLGPLLPPEEEPAPPPPPAEPAPAPPEVQRSSAQRVPPPELRPDLPSFLAATPAAPPPPAPAQLAGTLPLGASLPLPELPFQQGTPAQALASALSHARAEQGPSEPPRAAMGETVGVSTVGPAAASLPFTAPPLPAGCPELTLPQYASLRVELQLSPEQETAILGRYRATPGARSALDAHWRRRFEADPLSRMEFARAYAAYLGWLRQPR